MCLANSSPTLVQKKLNTWILDLFFQFHCAYIAESKYAQKETFFPGAIHLIIPWGLFQLIYACTSFPPLNTQAFFSNFIGKLGVAPTGKASVCYRRAILALNLCCLFINQPPRIRFSWPRQNNFSLRPTPDATNCYWVFYSNRNFHVNTFTNEMCKL